MTWQPGMPVKIKGAGLSGLATAITLAQRGIPAVVHEKRAAVGSFFDVDVHAFKNYGQEAGLLPALSNLGLDLGAWFPAFRLVHVSPSGRQYAIVSTEAPLYYGVLRGNHPGSLDSQLFRIAETMGVEFAFGCAGDEDCDVIATGSRRGDAFGYGAHFSGVRARDIHIFQDNRFAPGGYIYFMPYSGNEATVVATSFEMDFDIERGFQEFLSSNTLMAKLLSGAEQVCPVQGFANWNVPRTACRGEALYVGEAAGFADGGRGFGMVYALTSGILAARSIAECCHYDRLWRSTFGGMLFERFARRCYLGSLSNDDYDRIIGRMADELGEEVPLDVYQQRKRGPRWRNVALQGYARVKLGGWRRRHRLE